MYVTVLHVETQAAAVQQVLALRGQLAEKEGALDGLRATLSAARRSLTARAAAAELALAARGAQAAEAAGRAEQQDGELASAEAVSACQQSISCQCACTNAKRHGVTFAPFCAPSCSGPSR